MAERKLPTRRKKKNPSGKAVKLSELVRATLSKASNGRSYDNYLRKLLGLPDRFGNAQPRVEGMLETMTGSFFLKLPDVTWDQLEEDAFEVAIMTAAKRASKRVSRPLRMRELP